MIFIIPCHPGVCCLKISESSHGTSTVLSQLISAGRLLNTMVWRTFFAKRYSMTGILLCTAKSRLVMCLLGMIRSFFHPGVIAAMIPIPWKVPLPSIVRMLWSTLSYHSTWSCCLHNCLSNSCNLSACLLTHKKTIQKCTESLRNKPKGRAKLKRVCAQILIHNRCDIGLDITFDQSRSCLNDRSFLGFLILFLFTEIRA